MKSIAQMLKQLSGLIGTDDLSDWETEFVGNVIDRVQRAGGTTEDLSDKQVEKVEQVWKKHFAG